jgi:hypothetical protein
MLGEIYKISNGFWMFLVSWGTRLLGSIEAKCPTPPWPREPRGADDSDDALLAAAALPARPSANGAGPYAELLDAMQQNRFGSYGSIAIIFGR